MNPVRVLVSIVLASMLTVAGCSSSGDSNTGSPPPGPGAPQSPEFNQGVGFNGIVRTIVAAADGSQDLYVGGAFTNYDGITANRLIRLHQDGTAAQTFGQGFDSDVRAIAPAIDDSHAVYVGGPFSQFDGQQVPSLVRLTNTGLRDAGFQPSSTMDFAPATLAAVRDDSGDLYVGGNKSEGVPNTPVSQAIGRIVRLNPDGSPDPAFPIAAQFPGPADDGSPEITGLAALPGSGKVYVGGDMSIYNGQPVSTPLRMNPDGTVDATFMTGSGVPPIDQATAIEVIALDTDTGDLYAGGRIQSYNGMAIPFAPIRIKDTGALDTAFVPAVPTITSAIAPAVDGTGDVFVSGLDTQTQARPARLLRLNHNGGLVPTFNEPDLDDLVLTIVPVADGTKDLYIGGLFTMYNGVAVNHIARIHADGSLASTVTTEP